MIKYRCNHCGIDLETEDSLGMCEEPCPICGAANEVPPTRKQKRRIKEEREASAQLLVEKALARDASRAAGKEEARAQREAEEHTSYRAAIEEAKSSPDTPKIWYCRVDAEERGPMREDILQKWIHDGVLGRDDCVRPEDGDQWIRLYDIPERFAGVVQPSAESVETGFFMPPWRSRAPRLAIMIAAGAGMLGTFLPWVSMPLMGSLSGTAGDGWFTFVGFAVVMAFAAGKFSQELGIVRRLICALFAAGAGAIGMWKIIDLSQMRMSHGASEFEQALASSVTIGSGLYLITVAGAAAFIFSLAIPESTG